MKRSIKFENEVFWNGEICDIGSNNNGTYIKWANGFMICYGMQTCNANTYQSFNSYLNYGYINKVSDFPCEFKEPPIVHFSIHSSASVFALQPFARSSVTTTNTGGVYPIAPGHANNDIDISYIAYGFWK